jgi:hypothetical protein
MTIMCDTRFFEFALAARRRFALVNDDALRLIHEHTHRPRIIPSRLRALYEPLTPPYALVSSSSVMTPPTHAFVIRKGLDVILECTSDCEYHHSATESVAVRIWREPTIIPTDALEVQFHGEAHYHYLCSDDRRALLCFDPWLASGLSVELLKLTH